MSTVSRRVAVRDLVSLAKPRVTSLVLLTAGGGMWLAPGHIPAGRAILALAGTALAVAAANSLNCWIERESDGRMARTRNRPLPAGRLAPGVALAFGLALAVLCLPLMALGGGLLTAGLGALALVSYVGLYTPLKRVTPKALVVGAVPGALPPLMGWAAVTGRLDAGGLALFGILFFWQLPHFLAIALHRHADYATAGIQVTPVARGERVARWHAVLWTVVLVPISLLLQPLGVAGVGYTVVAAVLGATFLAWTLAGLRTTAGTPWARGLFRFSLAYLTILFVALGIFAV
jgi:protoheme IX farnesyltransferase